MKLLRRNPFSNNITYTSIFNGKPSIIKVGDSKVKTEYVNLKEFKDLGHFPEVYDFKEEDGEYTLTVEFLDGKNLADIIHLDKKWISHEMDIYSLKAIYPKILEVIELIHQQDRLYRDFNLEHFIQVDEKMYLVDLDCLIERDGTGKFISKEVTGTWETMAPEEFEEEFGSELGFYTNIYSLGIILYQLIYGSSPLKMQNFGIGLQKPLKSQQYAIHKKEEIEFTDEGNENLNDVISKATRKEPKERYQTVEELRRAFLECYL